MPFFVDKIDWGTSIRGCFWGAPIGIKDIEFKSCGLWIDNEQYTDTIIFSKYEWKSFINAVIEFARIDINEPLVD